MHELQCSVLVTFDMSIALSNEAVNHITKMDAVNQIGHEIVAQFKPEKTLEKWSRSGSDARWTWNLVVGTKTDYDEALERARTEAYNRGVQDGKRTLINGIAAKLGEFLLES